MENSAKIHSQSPLTITTTNAEDDIISEVPYDNELTLSGNELFNAVQKATSKEFIETELEKSAEIPQKPKKHSPRPSWYNITKIWSNIKNIKNIKKGYEYIIEKATWPMAKRVIKAAVAYWFAYVINLIVPIIQAIGPSTFLAIVMVCSFQPSRTFGSLFESAAWGIIAAFMAAVWSLIGITISDVLREPGQKFDIWATVIHISFMAIGTFILSYDKIKWPPMRFGALNACIIMTFSLTQAYAQPDNKYRIIKSLFIPMFIGLACSLLVNVLLWPENATTNYIPYLHKTLQSYIDLLDQETHFFLRDAYNRNTIAKLHRIVQDNLASLDIAKREAQHEISFSKIGPEDILEINRLVKSMRMTLGGLALSGVIEEELMKDGEEGTIEIRINGDDIDSSTDQSLDEPLSPASTIGTIGNEEDFTNLLNALRPICTELSEACQLCLADCITRVDHLQHNCSGPWYYRLWPFKLKPRTDHNKNVLDDPFDYLQEAIAKFVDSRKKTLDRLFGETRTISPSPQRLFLLLILFENSLKEVSESLGFLVGLIKVLSTTRQSKKFWLPKIPILKRIRNVGEIDEGGWKFYEHKAKEEKEEELKNERNEVLDPDVTPPSNLIQKFWYQLWLIRNWFNSKYAVFAFKNTLVVTCLCLPAFLPDSFEWFNTHRGQWAIVSAVLSFSPTTGGAVLQFLGRLIGVGMGTLMALIAWEMTSKGNVYGLAFVLFLFSLLLWFIYLNSKVWTVGGIIMLVNFPLVLVNTYQASHGVGMRNDIYTIAAMRTTAVSIGIAAAFVMSMIPWPHTGRVEVRHRLSRTIADIGVLYSMTVSSLFKGDKNPRNLITTKSFRKLATRIKRSIAVERLLLSRTVYEPPLRGNYPIEKYALMIDTVEHMVNLVSGMEYTLHGLNETEWKVDLADAFNPLRCHYVTHILTAFHILSTALENRVPLPPYNIISTYGQSSLGYIISRRIKRTAYELTKSKLETPAYACYCAYLIKTSHLTNELIKLVSIVRSLVGINRYVKELIDV